MFPSNFFHYGLRFVDIKFEPDAVLASPLSFHIPPGSNPSHPLGEKLPLQYQYDIQVFANQRYLLGSLSAEEIIDEFDTRVAEEGWTR